MDFNAANWSRFCHSLYVIIKLLTILTLADYHSMVKDFLITWEADYKRKAGTIGIFTDDAKTLSKKQQQLFVKLFYHARGHFDRFLWILASLAPNPEYRSIALQNIADELGGTNTRSHEQLYLRFADTLGVDALAEQKSEKNYMHFLKAFNKGHIEALLNGNWEEKWSIFSAYEYLDVVDYNNLYTLALAMGLSGDALTFFEVHRDADHFGDNYQLLEKVWEKDANLVTKAFTFIGNHQLKMWKKLSAEVFA